MAAENFCRKSIILSLIALSLLLSITGFVGAIGIPERNTDDTRVAKCDEGEDGVDRMIDCVDIHKQPAFDHPLLKNHTIQMRPSSYPAGLNARINNDFELFPGLLQNGRCPEGTIPISRKVENKRRPAPLSPRKKHLDQISDANVLEYAQVSVVDGPYYGVSATMNIWKPVAIGPEFSLALLRVEAGTGDDMNTIEAGWLVGVPDKQTRFFVRWTRDNSRKTGCYNLHCPGFVQTSSKFFFDGSVGPLIGTISTYGGDQYQMSLTIHKDMKSSNWWLRVEGQDVGYWPSTIFTSLAKSADFIYWGGEIVNLRANGHHTATEMGSGHFPGEGFGKASYFRDIGYIDNLGAYHNAKQLVPFVTRPECYNLEIQSEDPKGISFYFGGPGYSSSCQ